MFIIVLSIRSCTYYLPVITLNHLMDLHETWYRLHMSKRPNLYYINCVPWIITNTLIVLTSELELILAACIPKCSTPTSLLGLFENKMFSWCSGKLWLLFWSVPRLETVCHEMFVALFSTCRQTLEIYSLHFSFTTLLPHLTAEIQPRQLVIKLHERIIQQEKRAAMDFQPQHLFHILIR
jgi:hypothetical protein